MMVKIVAAGAFDDVWVSPDQACHAVTPSVRRLVLSTLIKKGWIQEVGGMVRATVDGLLALEKV
jgi:hypothetical protein